MGLLDLLTPAATFAGARSAAALMRVGSAAFGARESFQGAYEVARKAAADQRKSLVKSERAKSLGLTPQWYDQIAKEYGENALIEALLEKSEKDPEQSRGLLGWKGLIEDPFEPVASFGGYRERPAVISYGMLEALSRRCVPFTAYLQTRLNQVSTYCDPQSDKHGPGFVIRKREEGRMGAFSGKSTLRYQQKDKRAREIAEIVLNCGSEDRENKLTGYKRPGFHAFVQRCMRDSLVQDQVNIEKKRDRGGKLIAWRSLDAKTIRQASPYVTARNPFGERIMYAQVIAGSVVSEFSRGDLTFNIRNPRNDLRVFGYGFSELEMMVSTITALLNGFEYNSRFFTQGTTAKGLLAVQGYVPRQQMRAFRRMWTAMVTGAKNAWRTPILNIQDENGKVQWVDIQKSNQDMEFSQWLDWLVRSSCGVWQIAPEEIGYQMGNMGQASTMNEGSQADKIEASKDKGRRPLIHWLEMTINEELIWEIDDRYELAFVGMDSQSEAAEVELLTKEQASFMKVNEAREARHLDPLTGEEEELGELILNPQYVQAWTTLRQEKQMAEQMEGQGGEEGGDEGFDGVEGFGGLGDEGEEEQPAEEPAGAPAAESGGGEPMAKSLTRSARVRRLRSKGVESFEVAW